MSVRVDLDQRQLVLTSAGEEHLRLPLDAGGRHRIVAPDAATVGRVLNGLEACPGVAILPANGGLLGAMTVAENLSLALRYGADAGDDAGDWEHALRLALRLCGLAEARIEAIGRERPMNLDRIERWLVGFVRYLLRPPELLVLDRVFAGLSRRQAGTVIAIEAVYHDFHPFRPTLFVDVDAHELPAVPECRSRTELGEIACPC